jgi:uncharacterized protein
MILGILSDSHGNAMMTRLGVAALRDAGAIAFAHCGDVGFGILELLPPGTWFVFGNNDYDRNDLREESRAMGLNCLSEFGTFELAGKTVALTHGDLMWHVNSTIETQSADYLLTGHSHRKHDLRAGRLRRINPGALSKPRDGSVSVAVLNLATDDLRFIELKST